MRYEVWGNKSCGHAIAQSHIHAISGPQGIEGLANIYAELIFLSAFDNQHNVAPFAQS
jgi:hypothetical protein